MTGETILGIILGYLLGSIPFTQITAKLVKGIDLRTVGSKNVGGMNTIHNVGLGWGLLSGGFDVFKGLIAVEVAQLLGADYPQNLWAGLAAIAGHNWPVWLGFHGGKGIATTYGLSAWIGFPETLIGFVLGAVIYFSSKKNVVLAALVSFLFIPALMAVRGFPWEAPFVILGGLGIMIIATLPGALPFLRAPGGVRDYLNNPMQAYDDNEEK
jgi:glycerol-3-phosphate acyltransferase PlsY